MADGSPHEGDLPRFRAGELVRVVRRVGLEWDDDLFVEPGMTGRVAHSDPGPDGDAWVPMVDLDQLLEHPDVLTGLPIPQDALESLGVLRSMGPGRELGDPEAIDPSDHAASFWREISVGAYTRITDGEVAETLAERLLLTLRRLGIFDRVEMREVERHWHEPHHHRAWFHAGAGDSAAAFHRFVALRSGGWTYINDDGFHAEAGWSAEDDADRTPFLSPEVTHVSLDLRPQRNPRNRR